MNKKILLTVAALTAALLFTSCSKAVAPSDTSAETSSSVTTEEEVTETTEEAAKNYDHTFNPHCLSGIYTDKYGKEFEENYYRYCDAVLAGEDSVKIDKEDYLPLFRDISRYCLPIANEYAYFFDEDIKKIGDNTYELQYRIPKDEYLVKVDEFKQRIEYLIESALLEDDTYLEKALALYLSESARLDYDNDAVETDFESPDGLGVSPYRALMCDKGICQEIAGAYAYLLLQVGIDAGICSGLTKDGSSAHEWTIVKIDGKYYHCDVTFQCTNKYSLRYFGMNDARREIEGDWDIEYLNFGDINEIWHKDLPIEDSKFEPLWTSYTYFLDRDENMLYLYDDSGTGDACYFKMPLG